LRAGGSSALQRRLAISRLPAYWLVVAGMFVTGLLGIGGALGGGGVLGTLGAAGGSMAAELVEPGSLVDLFPQPARNITARIGMMVFISLILCIVGLSFNERPKHLVKNPSAVIRS
jgi:hypothetical protein